MEKHFQLSCPVFWGFNRLIDIKSANNLQDCINLFLDVHEEFLFENNYIDLLNFFKSVKKDYHIHGGTLCEIINSNNTIYVCRHNTSSENAGGTKDNFLR